MKSVKSVIAELLIVLAIFYVLGVAGGLEQNLISLPGAIARWAIALIVIFCAFCVADPCGKETK